MGGANGSRECAPDDKLRDTHQLHLMGIMGFAGSTHPTYYALRTKIGRDHLIDACACAVAARVLAMMKSISADCKCRSIADAGRAFARKQPDGQISVQSRSEKYFASPFGRNSFMDSAVSSHRGAYRDRHGRGMGCGGRGSVRRET